MKVEYHPFAVDDLKSAEIHYDGLQLGLSKVFKAEVIQTIELVRESPFLYAEVNGLRRALLRHFPFSIVYRVVKSDTIRILVIRHHKRHPSLGIGRR